MEDDASLSILLISKTSEEVRSNRPQTRTLGRHVEDIWQCMVESVNLKDDFQEQLGTDNIPLRAYNNWCRLQFLVSTNMIADHMNEEQWNSYRLLFDFWTAKFQHPSIPLARLSFCISEITRTSPDWDWNSSKNYPAVWSWIEKHKTVLYPSEQSPIEVIPETAYSTALWKLFVLEFCDPAAYAAETDSDDDPDVVLRTRRYEAAILAYCQNVAMQCLFHSIPDLFRPVLEPMQIQLDTTKFQDPICSLEASDPGNPRRTDRGPLITACPWLPKRRFRMYEDSEDEDDDAGGDDGLERDSLGLSGWPEYLWDLEKSCTVRTRTLGYNRPAYTAISHTWGRGARFETDHIHGGLTSPVPLNTTFDVTAIPESLRTLIGQINTEYVWLDLVCVPQSCKGELSEEDQRIRLQEIGRQDLIFRNASASVAWLHDVGDLSCLAALFQWLSLSMLELEDEPEHAHKRESLKNGLLKRIKDRRTGLSGHKDMEGMQRGISWFTSLWTLQELCLRPDMLLATSSLEIMSLDNGEHIPLNGLLCVYNRYVSLKMPVEDISVAMDDMSDWSQSTGLHLLLDLTEIDIFELARSRECKEGRAEAIMTAVGATSWFNKGGSERPTTVEAAQSQYPSEFVEEVRSHIQQKIFTTPIKHFGVGSNEWRGDEEMMVIISGELFRMYSYSPSYIKAVLDRFFLE